MCRDLSSQNPYMHTLGNSFIGTLKQMVWRYSTGKPIASVSLRLLFSFDDNVLGHCISQIYSKPVPAGLDASDVNKMNQTFCRCDFVVSACWLELCTKKHRRFQVSCNCELQETWFRTPCKSAGYAQSCIAAARIYSLCTGMPDPARFVPSMHRQWKNPCVTNSPCVAANLDVFPVLSWVPGGKPW